MPLARPTEKSIAQRYMPIVDWLPRYDWGKLFRWDVIAGLTVWALLVPEAMAYAGIAGVPPEVGLYTAPLALLGYAMFGTSRQLFVGPSSTVAILSASIVGPIAGGDEELFIALTSWLAIVTGVLFIIFGLVRMGWVANFMASPVLDGFMVGLALVIAVGQLDKIFGIESEGGNVLAELWSILEQFADWSWATIAVGVVSLGLLFLIEDYLPKIPGALTVLVLAIVMSAVFDFESHGIEIVGEIPAGLPPFGFPDWPGLETIADLVAGALAVVLVGYAESYAAAKSYANKYGYQVEANQELIGLGVANFGAGFSSGFVVDGSLSKTAAGDSAGQKTQMTGIVAAVLTVITIMALTPLFETLPEATLGAIVIHAVWHLIDIRKFTVLWSVRHIDFWLAMASFLGVVLIDILPGIVIGIVLSLLMLVYRASFPHGVELGLIADEAGHDTFVNVEDHPEALTKPGAVVYRFDEDLIYSNAASFHQQGRELLWSRTDPPADLLIVDCEQMSEMDVSGARELLDFHEELASNDVAMYLTRLHGQPARLAERAGIIDAVGHENVFTTIRSAVDAWNERHPADSPEG